ncbi:hypothetical protein LguiB_008879 [Lonicera macranthoides]
MKCDDLNLDGDEGKNLIDGEPNNPSCGDQSFNVSVSNSFNILDSMEKDYNPTKSIDVAYVFITEKARKLLKIHVVNVGVSSSEDIKVKFHIFNVEWVSSSEVIKDLYRIVKIPYGVPNSDVIKVPCRFIPDGCTVRLPEVNEEPTLLPRDGEIGIYTVLFEQAGLKLPLDPMLCDVLRRCNMALCQLSPNGVGVVLGCAALNRLLGVNLTWREIFWCYSLCNNPGDHSLYYFRARVRAPDLVKCLTKSEKGYDEGLVVVGGAWDDGNIHKIKRYIHHHVGIVIGEGPVERAGVTLTGLLADLGVPSTSASFQDKGKRKTTEATSPALQGHRSH